MARYTVTLYVQRYTTDKAKLTPVQVEANDSEGAPEAAIAQCENAGIIHGDIVSIVKLQAVRHG
jgi:hypothetical protein